MIHSTIMFLGLVSSLVRPPWLPPTPIPVADVVIDAKPVDVVRAESTKGSATYLSIKAPIFLSFGSLCSGLKYSQFQFLSFYTTFVTSYHKMCSFLVPSCLTYTTTNGDLICFRRCRHKLRFLKGITTIKNMSFVKSYYSV